MEITYKLHDSQYRIFHDSNRFIVLAAGRRFGKTVLALTKVITKALEVKKSKIWYIAPTYRQAEMIAWKMLQEMIPKNLISKKNEVKLEIILINGSEISLKGADNDDSLRGVGLDGVILDEYASMKQNVWQEIIRPMLADRKGWAFFIGTPKGKNHFWELWMKGVRKEHGFFSYQMKTEDNPFIPRSEIKEAKDLLNDRYFKQEFEASFEDFVGLVWPEFNHKEHVIDPFVIPSHWQRVASLDFAITGTTASLICAIDEDGTLYITEEYYQQNKRVSEVSESLKGKAPVFYADPAGRHKVINRNGVMFSFFDEYTDHGMILIPAQNEVSAGINRVAEFFKAKKIKIFKTCVNLIDELSKYHWSDEKETSSGVLEPKVFKSYDHACDCLRYLVMSRFEKSLADKKPIKNYTEDYFTKMEEQYEEQNV